jgi:hypothetical protein
MTRDSFDLFQPRDRGRFGDNEYSNPRVNAGAKSTLVDLDLSYCGQTSKAVGVKAGGSEWIWLPKSQIEFEMTGTRTVRVTLPRWLAKEKGLV